MGTVRMKIDFFQVVLPPDEPRTFADLIRAANARVDEARMLQLTDEWVVRLQEIAEWQQCLEGETIRVRQDESAIKVDYRTGEVSPVELEDDEALGEQTAFLYHQPTRTLMLQRNRFGVSRKAFCEYFREATDVEGVINAAPLPGTGALQRFFDLREFRRVEFRVGGELPPEDANPGVSAAVRLMEDYNAPFVTPLFHSSGHSRRAPRPRWA